MSTAASPSGGSRRGFARTWDAFSFKRIVDADFTDASAIGAALTLVGVFLLAVMVVGETVAYMTPSLTQEVSLAYGGETDIRLTFNITFPALPCDLLSLDVTDTLGRSHANLTANIHRFKVDAATGRALMLVGSDAPPLLAAGGRRMAVGGGGGEDGVMADSARVSTYLTGDNFEPFIAGTSAALVAFGAPWCPWSRRLAPVWEEVAGIVSTVHGIKLGRVECTDPASQPLCHRHHIAAYPTIMLYKGGAPHSHTHYHGERTAQALLNFLVAAQSDGDLVTDPHDPRALQDAHAAAERIARQLHLLEGDAAPLDGERGHEGQERGQGHGTGGAVDPAAPAGAMALIEAMHRAGLTAPGDKVRAAQEAARRLTLPTAVTVGPTPAPGQGDGDGGSGDPVPPPYVTGCQLVGYVNVARVPGVLTITPTPASHGQSLHLPALNLTHAIHDLWFGPRITPYQLSRLPPGTEAELHRLRNRRFVSVVAGTSHNHDVAVVGSTFTFATGHFVETYRYTANHHASIQPAAPPTAPPAVGNEAPPHVRLSYAPAPVAIHVVETRKPVYHFLTNLCAIIGGVYTVLSILDSIIHASLGRLVYKAGIGKAN